LKNKCSADTEGILSTPGKGGLFVKHRRLFRERSYHRKRWPIFSVPKALTKALQKLGIGRVIEIKLKGFADESTKIYFCFLNTKLAENFKAKKIIDTFACSHTPLSRHLKKSSQNKLLSFCSLKIATKRANSSRKVC